MENENQRYTIEVNKTLIKTYSKKYLYKNIRQKAFYLKIPASTTYF